MSPPTATASVSSLFDAIRQIEPVIRTHAADAERERRLPDAVADAMRACGLYRMWRPRAFGGLELDPMTAFQVIEEVSRIDSAAGWVLQLSSAIDAIGPWFADEGAKEIFGQPDTIFAGSFFPYRRAVPVEGGYRVTGQTPFMSGANQAQWFLGLAHIYDGDTARLAADGAPVTLLTMCPANDAVIVDTWRTLGMRGTGSHDVLMTDVFGHRAVLRCWPLMKSREACTEGHCTSSLSGPRYRCWRPSPSESHEPPSMTCWNSLGKRPRHIWRRRCGIAAPYRR